jgi:head-tail adaptor
MGLSTFLNGGTAVQLRGLAFLALSETGNVGAGTIVSDSGGGGTASWTYGGTIPCRIDPIGDRGDSRMTGGRIDERSTHVITVPFGTPVASANRFAITGRGTFEITAAREQTAEMVTFFEVIEAS